MIVRETREQDYVVGYDTHFSFQFGDEVVDQAVIEIFSAEECVSVGGFHLEHAFLDFQYGHVEGTTAQIVDSDAARTST